MNWLRKNLFNTWYNSILTVVSLGIIFFIAQGLLTWVFTQAQWAVIKVNWRLFFVGRFSQTQYWRIWVVLAIAITLTSVTWGVFTGKQRWTLSTVAITALIISISLAVLPPDFNSRLWLLLNAVCWL